MATILIVDDRPTNRELVLTLLGYAGHRVLEASEGEEGLEIARRERPDLIITDIVMPTMDGYEFARQVRADPSINSTQIIFHTSSYIVSETRRLAEACGVSMVLSKPIEPEYFLEKVNEALALQSTPVVPPASEHFHLAHMRLLTDTLAKKVEQLEAEVIERKRAEAALQTSEELFRSAFQYSPIGMCITSVDGKLQTVNQSLANMLGYSVEELIGKHFNDITYSDDLEIGTDVVSGMISGEVQSVAFEKRYLHKNGEPLWSHVSSTLLRESSGKPVHFITQILDISERKWAEQQLRAQTSRLKILADASQTFATAVQDYQKMLEIVARQTAEVMGGSCGVRLLSENGEWMEMVALHDVDAKALELARMLSSQPIRADEPNFIQRIMQSDRAILMPGISEDQLRVVIKPEDWDHLPFIASHSRLLAPIRTRSESLGFLIISRRVGSVAFDEHDLRLAQDLADRAALAISNARFFKQLQHELTEHQRTEAARLESEARYHRVLDAMMEGCQIIDFDWRYVYVNEVVAAQGKHTPKELINHTMMEMYPGIENTELFTVLRECMEQRTPRRMENRFAFPDGSLGWFELSVQPAREGIFILSTDITERKRAEEQLRRSEENFSKAFSSSPTALMITRRADGKYLELNKAYTSIVGYKRSELIGRLTTEFNIFTNPDQRKEIVSQLVANGSLYNYETQIQNKSGELRTVLASLEMIQFNGEDCILTTIVDITERKQAEEALRESEERFSKAFYQSPIGIVLIDLTDLTIRDINKSLLDMTGFSREEVINKSSLLLNLQVDPEVRAKMVQELQEHGAYQNKEMQLGLRNGEFLSVLYSGARVMIGGKAHNLALLQDITERKRAEEALIRERGLLQMLVENLPEEVYVKDLERRFLLVNDLVVQALGVQGKDEVIGMRDEDFMSPDLAKQFADEENEIMRSDKALINDEHRPPYRSGLPKWYLRTKLPLHDETGKTIGLVGLGRDITERKHAEEALQSKNEEIKAMSQQLWQAAKLATMGELAASIAHELNNPLATVSLRVEMLQTQFAPEDPQSKSLLIIASEVKRMSGLVMNLLQFSRRGSSQSSTIKVNEEIVNTLELVQYHLRKNNILTVQELSPGLPFVQADRQQLRQVFLNLFTNAADAMPLGGMLIIRTWSGGKPDAGITAPLQRSTVPSLGLPISEIPQVFIEISDTGEGITSDKLEKVWEPFYTTKPEGKGTGLGLAICRRIIQEHGGTIEVHSEGIPGKGTTVRLSLPAVKER